MAWLVSCALVTAETAHGDPNYSQLVYPGEDGKLVYVPDTRGNVIPDFSNCGYMGGGVRIPDVPVKVTLGPADGDDGGRIQAAIDDVSGLPPDSKGFRGAVLLKRGTYEIEGTLRIGASGVVLRGEGQGEDGTVLVATGKEKRTLIVVAGAGGREEIPGTRREIADEYVAVGARTFAVESAEGFRVGDAIVVRRRGNEAWIHEIGMDRITPRPDDPESTKQWGPFNLDFDRVITSINGNRMTVDAPIVCAIEARWGGGEAFKYADPGRIRQVGVEGLRGLSDFDRTVKATHDDAGEYYSDEEHCSALISFDNAVNAWARDLTALHFSGNVCGLGRGAKWVTVQDCSSLAMVSIITGGRRGPFNMSGQLCLVQRCYAETARHAFCVQSRVPGPNVFLDCEATKNYGTSEPHHRWSVGGLFDNVRAPLAIQDRQWYGSGHGWSGANYVAWNCEGTLVCQKPPTAQNYAIGHVGEKLAGAFAPREDGHWESHGRHVEPRSLYLKQLEDRLGPEAVAGTSGYTG